MPRKLTPKIIEEKERKRKLREERRLEREREKVLVLQRKAERAKTKLAKLEEKKKAQEQRQSLKRKSYHHQNSEFKHKDINDKIGLAIQKQKPDSNGDTYYYIRARKNEDGIVKKFYLRNPEGNILKFSSRSDALEYVQSENSRRDAIRSQIINKRINENKYPSILEKFRQFEKEYKLKAPNSWERAYPFFEHYLVPFFIIEKGLSNISDWMKTENLNAFKSWLTTAKPIKTKNRSTLSLSTQNHILVILNLFLKKVNKDFLSIPVNFTKLELYKDDQLNKKDEKALINEVHYELMLKKISQWERTEQNKQFYLFIKLLWNTGMRFSEAVGLALGDYIGNKIAEGHTLRTSMTRHGLEHYGYITLTDQLHNGVRKNLKSKKTAKDSIRILPIFDEMFNQELLEHHVDMAIKYDSSVANKNHIIFDELQSKTVCANLLKKLLSEVKLKDITFHNFRHTFTTRIVEKTLDEYFVRILTGHSSKSFNDYNHLIQKMLTDLKRSEGEVDYFKLALERKKQGA